MKRKARSKARSKAKITTIEGLAAAMAEGFADVGARFDVMEAKFDALHSKFDHLASDVRDLDEPLSAIRSKLGGVLRRLDDEAMEGTNVRALQMRMQGIEDHLFEKKQ